MVPILPTQVGVDEVGRGAWAGPMVAAAVLFPIKPIVPRKIQLRDSKLLTKNARMRAFDYICKHALYAVVEVNPTLIDEHGVHHAHKNLIVACISGFIEKYEKYSKNNKQSVINGSDLTFYIDGNRIIDQSVRHAYKPHGDRAYKIISCASIIAKVYRDSYMKKISMVYPHYGFDQHVGYGTRMHQKALAKYGPCEIHRMSYKPLKSYPQPSEK